MKTAAVFLFLLLSFKTFSNTEGASLSKRGLYFSMFGTSRYQLNSRNYFKYISRQDHRNKSTRFGGTIGYQLITGSVIEEFMVEVGFSRVKFHNPNDTLITVNDDIIISGVKIPTMIWIFPLSFKVGYAKHDLTGVNAQDKKTDGIYFGLGFDISFFKRVAFFFDLTNYKLKYQNNKRYLSGFDIGIRIHL